MTLYKQIQEATEHIQSLFDFQPKFGIILGTGLGNLTDHVLKVGEIEYKNIPHFPLSTVPSHKGKFVFGWLDGVPVAVMAGRFHYYEGYTMQQVTFPVRVLKALGVEKMVITNVSGSTNARINPGDIVLVNDHINLMGENPLRGEHDPKLGLRFPDMMDVYNKGMRKKALEVAGQNGIIAHEGVYVGLQGPSLETPAEYRFLNIIGGDLVGMSTVPEVIVSRQCEMPVMVVSVVSNKCFPIEEINETTVEEVIAVAAAAEPKMTMIIKEVLKVTV
jgi:purine-nucleoside phosphorylase